MPIDNDASEREMERAVLKRKNSLFVGNEHGGRTAAIRSGRACTCRSTSFCKGRILQLGR